jgi:DNA-binding Xre family transcriptional regulator
MTISYIPLFKQLLDRGMKKTDLLKEPFNISPPTLAKLSKGEPVDGKITLRLAEGLDDCQVNDIMEYVRDKA